MRDEITREKLAGALDDVARLTEQEKEWVEKFATVDKIAADLKAAQIEIEKYKNRVASAQKAKELLKTAHPEWDFAQKDSYLDEMDMTERDKAGLLNWLIGSVGSDSPSEFKEYIAKADLNENTNAQGLYLVPTQYLDGILGQLQQSSIAMRDSTRIVMAGKTAQKATWATGWTVSVYAEGATVTTGEPTFGQVTLTAHKVASYGLASSELFDDAAPNLVDELIRKCVNDVSVYVDGVMFTGEGSPTGHTGIIPSAGNVVTIGTAFSDLTYANLVSGYSKLSTIKIQGAKWYMSPYVFSQILGLTDSNGRPLWGPDISGGLGQILGHPIVLCDALPSSGDETTAAQRFMLFGNMKNWIYGDRRELSFERARVLPTDQWEMLFRTRLGFPGLSGDSGSVVAGNFVAWTTTAG